MHPGGFWRRNYGDFFTDHSEGGAEDGTLWATFAGIMVLTA